MEELSEKFQRFNPFTRKNRGCKWSLPATEEQLLQQKWKFLEVPGTSTILGEGGGGIVYIRELRLCRCTKCSPVVCAVKRIDNSVVQTTARLQRETQIMEALGKFSTWHKDSIAKAPPEYQYIVPFFGSYVQDRVIHIAMQFMPQGDLGHFMEHPWGEVDVRVVTEQLCLGLKYLHEHNIAHRDIKPTNIFPHFTKDGHLSIKVGDFGSAKSIESHGKLVTIIGSWGYMAPEIWEGEEVSMDESAYTVAVDIWSLGCLLYRLLRGEDLFKVRAQIIRYEEKKQPSIRDGLAACSEDTIEFLEQLIEPVAKLRVPPREALTHHWLTANPKGFGNRMITQKLANYCRAVINKGTSPTILMPGGAGKHEKKK